MNQKKEIKISTQQQHHIDIENYDMLFNNMNSAFILLEILFDKDGNLNDSKILMINKAFEELFQKKKMDLLGNNSRYIFDEIDLREFEPLLKIGLGRDPKTFEYYYEPLNKFLEVKIYSPKKHQIAAIINDITVRKNQERRLVSNENLLNTIFDGISDPIYVVDKNFKIIMANKAMVDFQEEALSGMIGQYCFNLFKNKSEICTDCYIKKVFETGKTESHENIVTTKKGHIRYINSFVYPIKGNNGKVKQVVEIARDITEKKKIESKLKQSNDTLIKVLDNIEAIVYVADMQTYEVLFMNKYAIDLFGKGIGEICYRVLHGNNKPCEFCTNSMLIDKNGKPRGTVNLDYQHAKTGKWYHIADNVIEWINGENVKIEIGIDITNFKNAEIALRKSEINHRTFLQNLDGISYQTYTSRFQPIFMYGKIEEITGFEKDFFINKQISWDQIVHPDDRHLLDDKSKPNIQETNTCEKTYRIIKKDGTIRWLNDISSYLELPEMERTLTNGIIYDITEKKQAQEDILENERKFRTIFDNTAVGIVNSSIETLKFININQKFCEITGYTESELMQMSFMDITHPEDLEDDRKKIKQLIKGEIKTFTKEKRYFHKSGKIIWGYVTVSLAYDLNTKPMYFVASLQDISQRKESEEILRKSEARLKELIATKDKFFSIIAHDLKNPFNTLLGFTELLLENFDNYDKEKTSEIIKILNETSQNSYRLLENLLEWSRSQTGTKQYNPQKTNLSEIVGLNLQFLNKTARKKNIKLISSIKKDFFVNADVDMLNTVLRNLIGNAIKFTLPGGKVVVTCVKYKSKIKNNLLKISVIDNGIGIRDEDFEKLFRLDITHTTQGTGNEQGTGLGLILCKEFIAQHGGEIWVINNRDSKNKFNIASGCNFSFTLSQYKQ